MGPADVLTRAELYGLTGRQHADRQVAWLIDRGWPFEVGADDRPRVARAEWERRMLSAGTAPIAPPVRKTSRPRLDRVR